MIALALGLLGCGGAEPPADAVADGRPGVGDWRAAVAGWHYEDPLPDLPLVDQDGQAFSLGALAGSWVLVGFIYTACPDAAACPMTTQRMAAVQRAWEAAPRERSLRLLSLTLDPERDTPATLRAYAERHRVDTHTWTLATGEPALLTEGLPSLFNVLSLPSADGTLDHTVKLALLDPTLRQVAEWKDNAVTADEIVARVLQGG